MKRPTVGQKVWVTEKYTSKPKLIECVVEKVGRKYLHVEIRHNVTLFHLDGAKNTDRYRLYMSKEAHGQVVERALEQCRAIMEVLDK